MKVICFRWGLTFTCFFETTKFVSSETCQNLCEVYKKGIYTPQTFQNAADLLQYVWVLQVTNIKDAQLN